MPDYTLGPARWYTPPRLRTKPSGTNRDGTRDTGGGYERIRSYEYRPETARQGKEDVYVSHHRLLAVVACYPDDMPLAEILEDLRGSDVHHESGVEWDNRPENLTVLGHAEHASITNAERRAWAEDAKGALEADDEHDLDRCAKCDAEAATLARSDAWEGTRCLDCAMAAGGDDPIEVV